MAWVYDSHIHMSDPAYRQDMAHILTTMKQAKIRACCVSTDYKTSQDTLSLAGKSSHVLPFVGIHPECASDSLEPVTNMIQNNIRDISGIGEIGLDSTLAKSSKDSKRQRHVFESLLDLAEKHHKPVSIHSRKSLDEVLKIMTSYTTKHASLHWFDGNKRQLRQATDMGLFVSFGPVTIYANDKQALLSRADPTKILVETDGPVRFSRCFEMRPAQIDFVPSVIFCASKILKKSYEDMALLLEENSEDYLGV